MICCWISWYLQFSNYHHSSVLVHCCSYLQSDTSWLQWSASPHCPWYAAQNHSSQSSQHSTHTLYHDAGIFFKNSSKSRISFMMVFHHSSLQFVFKKVNSIYMFIWNTMKISLEPKLASLSDLYFDAVKASAGAVEASSTSYVWFVCECLWRVICRWWWYWAMISQCQQSDWHRCEHSTHELFPLCCWDTDSTEIHDNAARGKETQEQG